MNDMVDLLEDFDVVVVGACNNKLKERLELPVDISLGVDLLSYGCGGQIWDAAIILSDFISNGCVSLDGKRVLELGSGTGVLGILACKSTNNKFEKFIMTDLEKLEPFVVENVKSNNLEIGSKLDFCGLDWMKGVSDEKILNSEPFDYVFVADCVYLECLFMPLLDTLKRLVVGGTVCYMSYKRRRRAEKKFFVALKKWFRVTEVRRKILIRG